MALANLHMGYVGSAKIGGTPYFVTGSSLNPVQTVDAPDLVAGHWMRRGWNYSKVEIGGNLTGPLHEGAGNLWPTAWDRKPSYDHLEHSVAVEVAYFKGGGRKFNQCVINNLTFSCTAGDVCQFTVDFVGYSTDYTGSGDALDDLGTSTEAVCSKLVTWDRTAFGITPALDSEFIQAFTITLNNNVQRAYAIRGTADSNLYPVDVPCGVREITGTLSMYAGDNSIQTAFLVGEFGADTFEDYCPDTAQKDVTFKILPTGGVCGGSAIVDATFEAVFNRPEASAQTGLTIYTLNFTAVCTGSLTI